MTESNGIDHTPTIEEIMKGHPMSPRPPAQQPQQQAQLMMGHKPRTFAYKPQDDITAYEVAHILQFVVIAMTNGGIEEAYARLPETAKRHMEIIE